MFRKHAKPKAESEAWVGLVIACMPVRFGKVTGAIFSLVKPRLSMILGTRRGTAFKVAFTDTVKILDGRSRKILIIIT